MEKFFIDIFIYGIPLIFAVVLHEVAHGWVAYKRGDPTAYSLGRLSLNPIKHVDLWGTIIFPAVELIFTGHVFFGWAKPVPVNYRLFKDPRRDITLVAAAGPLMNFSQAVTYAVIVKLLIYIFPTIVLYHNRPDLLVLAPLTIKIFLPIMEMAIVGVLINLFLGLFNLIPIPPLDGSKVLMGIAPDPVYDFMKKIEPYGFTILILIIFLVPGLISGLINPIINFVFSILF